MQNFPIGFYFCSSLRKMKTLPFWSLLVPQDEDNKVCLFLKVINGRWLALIEETGEGKKKTKPTIWRDWPQHILLWDRFADKGQPPGTLIKKGVGRNVPGSWLSRWGFWAACFNWFTLLSSQQRTMLPISYCKHFTSKALSSSGPRGHDSQPCLFLVQGALALWKTCRFKHPEGLRGRGQMDISLK